jgi:hypothetical protein
MNDNELDDLLNAWSTPPVSPSLRERVRRGFQAAPIPGQGRFIGWRWIGFHWKGISAAAALALGALLLMVPLARPQAAPPAQWTVDSEFLAYADDGSSSVEMLATSYLMNGNETIWSRWSPDNPLKTAMWAATDGLGGFHNRLVTHLMFDRAKLEAIRKQRESNHGVGVVSGCGSHCMHLEHFNFSRATSGPTTACIEGVVVGHDTILNYPVAAVRYRWTEHGRMTLWMTPDLGCFALRSTYEIEVRDGSFRLVAEKRAVKLNGSN